MKPAFASEYLWLIAKGVLESWKGTPYRHLWMKKGRGADCSLFVGAVLKELGIIKKVEHDCYPPDWFMNCQNEKIKDGFERLIRCHMQPNFGLLKLGAVELMRGDIAAFSTVEENPVTNHAGILLDPPTEFLHSVRGRGVSAMHWGSYWLKRTTAIYRVVVC